MSIKAVYRHTGVALLRATRSPLGEGRSRWPDLADPQACREWLDDVWADDRLADAMRQASPSLGRGVDTICAGDEVPPRRVRSATRSTMRYLLRSTGRPTPFGLFAGVGPVDLAGSTSVRWGAQHYAVCRASAGWLADIVDRAEQRAELLDRLDVVCTDLAVRRGGRLEVPDGPNRTSIRHTRVTDAVAEHAARPVRFGELVDVIAGEFGADRGRVRGTLVELVRCRYLITSLRAPFTDVEPISHVVDELRRVDAHTVPELGELARELSHIDDVLRQPGLSADTRATVTDRMRALSASGRTPTAVDLVLDCDVSLPHRIAFEMERAATVLLRTTRHPRGEPAWWGYHAAFVDRYGVGTLVPLTQVLDPDSGIGYPATYRGSVMPEPPAAPTPRDEHLLTLAWRATVAGSREIVLSDDDVVALTDNSFDERHVPPHVELAARIHAASSDALDEGEYRVTISPARSAGTLTSRFTPIATGSGLAELYRDLPAATEGALRVQMSFGPMHPHAENVSRVPTYLDHVLPLGEHRPLADNHVTVDDLALSATRERLHLVSQSRRQVVEPQVFHALALDKQPPPLARFLAQLPRAFSAAWYQFDWGPHTNLPFLPQIRYQRTVLSPAQWRLTTADIPRLTEQWPQALEGWRHRWNCPAIVELRDADRTLRLDLDEPAHASLLRAHLEQHGQAVMTSAAPASDYGWLSGHVHEVAFPLVTRNPPAPNPLRGHLPSVDNCHGQHPAAKDVRWLSAKVFTHPERMSEIITDRLPTLLAMLDQPASWWLRYRSPHERDHLRLRIRVDADNYGQTCAALGEWTAELRHSRLVGNLVLDTYRPEIGRYGDGDALHAAEAVFCADSTAAAATLRTQPTELVPHVVANMVDIACAFLGSTDQGMHWLAARDLPSAPAPERAIADHAIQLALEPESQPRWQDVIEQQWAERTNRLTAYRHTLPTNANVDYVLESLLHMHHNRLIGVDPDSERTCLRLARSAAHARSARDGQRPR